ncbi:DUF1064 domain-containing protein [Bacillus sp. MRMR6]|uniref:DUF1064 domain-containing protein n=1 Tax=Bacillus sp. MRMR6 TaxID=1928617 RepID=UPI00095365EA|nr:DUF1064 domain-containing protein [Bacillus sp. MRMR6]OLS39115.1 hypothetical protein BTR25_13355 [Bacillus sp. MRMR6]
MGSKYGSKKVEFEGHIFDSQLEARYFKQLKWLEANKQILFFRIQPRYLLQEAFEKNGKKYRRIDYLADFEIHHLDGSIEVVDCKGVETTDFKLKKKLFEYRFPHTLSLVTYSKIDGGWITLEQLAKNRKLRKAVKESGSNGGNRRRQNSMDETRG